MRAFLFLFSFLFLFTSINAVSCEIESTTEKSLNDFAKVVSYQKCDFSEGDRNHWEKNKQLLIDFAKSFEGVAICPSNFLQGMRQQLAEDVDGIYNAFASYAQSDPVKNALAVRAAAVSMMDSLRNSPQAFESFIRGLPEIPSKIYEKVNRWMRNEDCHSALAQQKLMCASAGAMFAAAVTTKGRNGFFEGERLFEKVNKVEKFKAEIGDLDFPTNSKFGRSLFPYVSNVPVLEYNFTDITVRSFEAYLVESSFFRGAKNALLLAENEGSMMKMNDVAKFNSGTHFISTSIDHLPKSKLRNLESKMLDNTKPFPAEWKNKFDRVLMNHGLCLCHCRARTCGGIESTTAEAKGFLARVTDVLDKNNKNARAVLTASPHFSNISGPDDLKIWIQAASQVMHESNVEIRVFQRQGRLMQIEVRPR